MDAMKNTEESLLKENIISLIEGFVKLKKSGNVYHGLCPFHNEKALSFIVSPDKQLYHCFGCGANGDSMDFMRKYDEKYQWKDKRGRG